MTNIYLTKSKIALHFTWPIAFWPTLAWGTTAKDLGWISRTCVCPNCKMYFSRLILVQIAENFSTFCKMYLPKLQNVDAKIAK